MIRRAGGSFRGIPFLPGSGYQLNVQDSFQTNVVGGLNVGGWTLGGTVMDLASLPTAVLRPWSILDLEISCELLLRANIPVAQPANSNIYGKLSPVVAALIPMTGQQTLGNYSFGAVPWQCPQVPMPPGASSGLLWDPSADTLPPIVVSGNNPVATLRKAQTISFAQPVPMAEGSGPLLGIWIMPSLLNWGNVQGLDSQGQGQPCVSMCVLNAQWAIHYDDGK